MSENFVRSADNPLAILARKKHAELFRQAAGKLRQSLTWMERFLIKEQRGWLIIDAVNAGYLAGLPELQSLVDWHTGDGTNDRKPGMQAVLVRCASNLFLEVAGGHLVWAQQRGGQWTTVDDPRTGSSRHGGLVPKYQPRTLRLTDAERQAETCELLAELIEANTESEQANSSKSGITEFKKIASMADTYYVSVAPHNPNAPICTIASIHACLAIPNFLVLEFFEPDELMFHEIIEGGLRREKSVVRPPTGPVLGVRISDEFLKKHRFDEKKTREMERRTFDTMK
jgi:hypothetical protein